MVNHVNISEFFAASGEQVGIEMACTVVDCDSASQLEDMSEIIIIPGVVTQ